MTMSKAMREALLDSWQKHEHRRAVQRAAREAHEQARAADSRVREIANRESKSSSSAGKGKAA